MKLWRSVHIRGFSAIEIRFSLDFAVRHSSWSVNVDAMVRSGTSFSLKTSSEEKVPVFPGKPTLKSAKQVQKYTKYTHSTFMVGLSAFNHLWGKCGEKIGETSEGKWRSSIFSVLQSLQNPIRVVCDCHRWFKASENETCSIKNNCYRAQQETLQINI